MRKICVILAFLAVLLAFVACNNPASDSTPATSGVPSTPGTTSVIAVDGVSLNKESVNILVGEIETLTVTITPENATNKDVTWTSSNTSVATVSTKGEVTAVSEGTAYINAATKDGGYQARCTVTVSQRVSVTGVSLKASTELLVNHTETLYAIIEPDNATYKNVTWSSSNTSVATVSTEGIVTAVSAGTTTVTVTTVDGKKTASCTVTVSNISVPVTGVSLNKTSASLVVGNTEELTATITPTTATNQIITWNSSNTTVAEVSAAGVVTANNVGTANITVTTDDGNKTASCNVTVNPKVITFTIDAIPARTYTGSAISPIVTVRDGSTALTLNTDYTVAYTNNINAGPATVTVSGTGNYVGSSGSGTFTINAKVITFTVDAISAQTYTGTPITPTIGVKDGSTTLKLTTDYTVTYSNNTNAGTATVTVSGVDNYAGSSGSKTFNINKATGATVISPTLNKATQNSITINAIAAPSNGQTVEYARNTTNTAPSSGWQNGVIFNELEAGTDYYIFARSKGNTNYNAGTASTGFKVTTVSAFIVNSVATLQKIGTDQDGWTLSAQYKQTADINMTGVTFKPIGTYSPNKPFTGTYDGNNYKISNLVINSAGTDGVGLFGYIAGNGETTGIVKNVKLEGGSVNGNNYVGGVVGYSFSLIQNCYSTGSVNGNNYVGGVVGGNESRRISEIVQSSQYTGGIVQSCYSTGSVTGNGFVGGVVGRSRGGDYFDSKYSIAIVQNCYSTGSVTSNEWSVGGVVGYVDDGEVRFCYSSGNVSNLASSPRADNVAGGVVGSNVSGAVSSIVENCYSIGNISGSSGCVYIGGVVGYSAAGTVQNCYSTGNISGIVLSSDPSNYHYSVGGVVGYYDLYILKNCVALNSSVTGTYCDSVCGYIRYGSFQGFSDNRARSDMRVVSGISYSNNIGHISGTDITIGSSTTQASVFSGWDTAVWNITGNLTVGATLPTLRNMPTGTQNPKVPDRQSMVTIDMFDSYGDGWNGNGALRINVNGVEIANNIKVPSGSRNSTYSFYVKKGDFVQVYWVAGQDQQENSFIMYYSDKPPSPAFTASNSSSWNGTNALLYKLSNTMNTISNGTLLGSFTVP